MPIKIIAIEGWENVGKTTLISKLKEKYPELKCHHYPSKNLLERWKDVVTGKNKNQEDVRNFICDVTDEIYGDLLEYSGDDIVVLDRFHLSGLVYQGEGIDPMPSYLEHHINGAYLELICDLGLYPRDIQTFVLTHQYGVENDGATEAQKENDTRTDIKDKYTKIISNADKFTCLGNISVLMDEDTIMMEYPVISGAPLARQYLSNGDYVFTVISDYIDSLIKMRDHQ